MVTINNMKQENYIRIRTWIGKRQIFTYFLYDHWVTIIDPIKCLETDSLEQAGQNHLLAACELRDSENLNECKKYLSFRYGKKI